MTRSFEALVLLGCLGCLVGCGNSSSVQDAGGTRDAGNDAGTDAGVDSCLPLIGAWNSTLDAGSTIMMGGQQIPISGTIAFTLVHDDADYPNIVDFNGTATIVVGPVDGGQVIVQPIGPASSPTGDPHDSTCTGGLHLFGQATTTVGTLDFMVDATLNTTVSPPTGTGTFSMKSDADDGGTASGWGGISLVKQ